MPLQPGTSAAGSANISGTVAISAADGSFAVYFSPSNPSVNATIDTSGTFKMQASDGSFAVYFSQSNPKVNLGNDSITGLDRVRNLVDGTLTTVIPGTGATNLGKAVDSPSGATDTGVAILARHIPDQTATAVSDGDYELLETDSLGSLHVNAESHHVFDSFDATTGWTALSDDTLNLATTTKHVQGTAALTFDKVNGTANTVFAGIQKTLSSVNLGEVSSHDLLQGAFYIPDITNVSYAFLRLGTNSSNYNEWRIPDTALTAATFLLGSQALGDVNYAGITGNGWNPAAITYIAVGVAFDAETNTLAGIIFDEISYHTNQHTSTNISSEVTSTVNTPNINVQRVGGVATATNGGTETNGVQRVTLPTNGTGGLARIDRIMNVVDGTMSVENITRLRNLVDGTLSLVTTVTGVDRVRNLVDGTLSLVSTVTGVDRVRNVVDGTLTTVTGLDRVRNVVDGTISLVSMTQRVNNVVDGTIGIARFGSNAVVTPNAGIPVVNTSNTMSIFSVSGSSNAVTTSGLTLVAPSASYNYKVFAYSITTTGIVGKTVRFTNGSGASPTEFWRIGLQAPTTSSTGANFGVQPPGYIFATGTNTTLALLLDTASLVHYSVSYIKESA